MFSQIIFQNVTVVQIIVTVNVVNASVTMVIIHIMKLEYAVMVMTLFNTL